MLIELPQAGQAPRRGAGLDALPGEQGQVVQDLQPRGLGQTKTLAVLVQPAGEGAQVGLIGGQGIGAQPPLQPKGVSEGLDEGGVGVSHQSLPIPGHARLPRGGRPPATAPQAATLAADPLGPRALADLC